MNDDTIDQATKDSLARCIVKSAPQMVLDEIAKLRSEFDTMLERWKDEQKLRISAEEERDAAYEVYGKAMADWNADAMQYESRLGSFRQAIVDLLTIDEHSDDAEHECEACLAEQRAEALIR